MTFSAERIFAPPQTGINVGLGVGKTQTVIDIGLGLLKGNPSACLAVFVPGHAQTADLERRWNEAAGKPIAAIYRGPDQPDPDAPEAKMCRCAEAAEEVRKAGGKSEDVCGSSKRGRCPFHPKKSADNAVCGYQRQRACQSASKFDPLEG